LKQTLLENDKVIFSFLAPCKEIGFDINPREHSYFSIYSWLPTNLQDFIITLELVQGNGGHIIFENQKDPIANFFRTYKNKLTYKVYFSMESKLAIAVNKSNKPIGLKVPYKAGVIYFFHILPLLLLLM